VINSTGRQRAVTAGVWAGPAVALVIAEPACTLRAIVGSARSR
jgi:hypothetical protein